MRRFLPAGGGGGRGGGGGGEPSSSSSSPSRGGERAGAGKAAPPAGLRYGGSDISLGPGRGREHHAHDLYGQFHGGGGGGGEAEMDKDGVDMLARRGSSPAGFFSSLMVPNNGFAGSKAGAAGGDGGGGEAHHHHRHPSSMASNSGGGGGRKMKSQLSFTAAPAAGLSQIPDDGASLLFPGADRAAGHSGSGGGGGFSIVGPWEESRDIAATLGGYEFGGMAVGSPALEVVGVDRYLQLQQDKVPFKVRAKRGCATHPRSIAERERRTRISDKLRKLQELVPNMDKQTSTSDMLDLAVEHIKGLQTELQNLKHEQDRCTCCSKP